MTTKVFVIGKDSLVSRIFFDRGYEIVFKQEDADILVWIGGADIDPSLYDQKANPTANVRTNLDNDKRDLKAWEDSFPSQFLVGICRGGQFLNVMNGGSMYQHVSGHNVPHKMYDTLFDKIVYTSSCHHQMMVPTDKAEVIAYVQDHGWSFTTEQGLEGRPEVEPEVLWYPETKSLCFQGHPEYYSPAETREYFFDVLEKLYGRV